MLRKSARNKKSAIPSDYMCYMKEFEYDIGGHDDPVTCKHAIKSSQSAPWEAAMIEELDSMANNDVWSLVEGSP